jgi:Effector-associated domain 1
VKLRADLAERLRDGIVSAFKRAELDQFTTLQLSKPLEQLVGNEVSLTGAAFELVRWAEANGKIPAVTTAIRKERPDRLDLKQLCDEIDVSILPAAPLQPGFQPRVEAKEPADDLGGISNSASLPREVIEPHSGKQADEGWMRRFVARIPPIARILLVGLAVIGLAILLKTTNSAQKPPEILILSAEMNPDSRSVEIAGQLPTSLATYARLVISKNQVQPGFPEDDYDYQWLPQGAPLLDNLGPGGLWRRTVSLESDVTPSSTEYRVLHVWIGGPSCVSQIEGRPLISLRPSECAYAAATLLRVETDAAGKRTVKLLPSSLEKR